MAVTTAPTTTPRPVAARRSRWQSTRERPSVQRQLVLQVLCLFILLTVLFPIVWVFSVSLDPLSRSRPEGLSIIPDGATLDAYARVISQPTNNAISFLGLALNSLKIAIGASLVSVVIAVGAAYAFSRLRFRGRATLMLVILGVLMLPPVATLTPLFVMLNKVQVELPLIGTFNLRNSILGVNFAVISGLLPFAIWNLKGYLDTIPRELEEAAAVDGATLNQTFLRIILPLATPALAVTAFLGFVAGWTEFYLSRQFLNQASDQTLALALNAMVGQYTTTPWSMFSAFAIMFALPPALVYLVSQRYITSGLAIGGVKG